MRRRVPGRRRPVLALPSLVLPSLALLSLLGLPLWALAQSAAPSADPLQQQLEQQRAVGERQRALLAQIRGSFASLSSEEQATLAGLDRLNADIDRLRGQAGLLDLKLRQTEARLGVTGRDILALQSRVAELRGSVALNLNALYRERTGEYLALLAQAQTLPELILRLRWANYAGERQVALIRELDREAGRLQGELAAQQQARAELQTLQKQRQAALAELSDRQTQAQALLGELRRTAAGQRLLQLQGQAELAQTGQNIDTLLDAAVRQQEGLAAQRRRELEAQRQREAETAARLRAAEKVGAAGGPSQVAPVQSAAARPGAAAAPTAQSPAAQPSAARPTASRSAAPAPATAAPASPAPAVAQSTAPARQSVAPQAPAAQARPPAASTPAVLSSAPAAAGSDPVQTVPQQSALQEPALPTPQQLTEARTQAEAQVQLTEAQLAPLRGRLDALAFPLPGGQVSEGYTPESPWAVIRAGGERQARAAGEGVVLAVTSFSSLGWVVLLDHGDGLVTAYLGLNQPAVQVGERIQPGAPLGEIGGSPVFGPDAMAFQVSRVEGERRTPLPSPF
ncbi:Peptidase M23 [Deinococcus proteolyticus MRP]|uniref:Peptidase M23 n=1 Tax=Deinococcus proteolyticus (strain ATCC 35074 / DSM 20540 / JCM 6276 / NBRC 101906 / NCIMB 13154 / VKM Ac-1939 / CCM 2703 / MRP) TaxID=693977 RepID=F0RN25_DEIPM|nr:peptidoglycan DD-metalloendopeptidase family protein [Deinococcus proteolyticus]ADY26167.1 Peptidase M23 [Deinococcus proteolyticus MRP]